MILLSKQTPLGAGRHRKCYTHPDNARLKRRTQSDPQKHIS